MAPVWFRIGCLACGVWLASVGADARAQALKLDDRVAPPVTVSTPVIPNIAKPADKPLNARDRDARAAWSLPVSEIPRGGSTSKSETRGVAWRHPALDVPLVAVAERPALPLETHLPTVASAFARGANPEQPHPEIRSPREVEGLPRAADDPKALAAFRFLTNPVAAQPPQPVPLLRLYIPDPLGTVEANRIASVDLDRDPPVVPLARPAPPAR